MGCMVEVEEVVQRVGGGAEELVCRWRSGEVGVLVEERSSLYRWRSLCVGGGAEKLGCRWKSAGVCV